MLLMIWNYQQGIFKIIVIKVSNDISNKVNNFTRELKSIFKNQI